MIAPVKVRSFWKYGHGLCFSPRVKPIGRYTQDGTLWVRCRVTGRDQAHQYHGYKPGDIVNARAGQLYHKSGLVRGSCGRCWYEGKLTVAELAALPVVTP
jgi:hypothetical protein